MKIGTYVKLNGKTFTNAGYLETTETKNVNICVERIIHAGNINETDIKTLYVIPNTFIFLIKSDVYSICYTSIISEYKEFIKNGKKMSTSEQEDDDNDWVKNPPMEFYGM